MSNSQGKEIVIVIESEYVSINGTKFETRPLVVDFQQALGSSATREVLKGPEYLPALVFDDVGLVGRYRAETGRLALVDVHFATSRRKQEPANPFCGTVVLNGQNVTRPALIKSIRFSGAFNFDDKPVPAAGGRRIGVSIIPKFEYVGVINFGWHVD